MFCAWPARCCLLAAAFLLLAPLSLVPGLTAARAGEGIAGTVVGARVLRVIDGDTFEAEAHVWPGAVMRVSVRIRGIDAPELHARCAAEARAALAARDALAALLGQHGVLIFNIGGGKYYGRVLADVATAAGVDVAGGMLQRGLVRPYGGGRRAGWCG